MRRTVQSPTCVGAAEGAQVGEAVGEVVGEAVGVAVGPLVEQPAPLNSTAQHKEYP